MPDPEPLKLASLPSEADMPLRMKEGNLVTIVQTDSSPVIVTVSGSTSTATQPPDTEVEILAHLWRLCRVCDLFPGSSELIT